MTRKQNCNEQLLTLYHYGELDAAGRRDLEAHLDDCPECRAALAELKASLAAVPGETLTLSGKEKLEFAERVARRVRRRQRLRSAAWGGAAAAAAAFTLAVVLLRPDTRPVPVVPAGAELADFEVLEQLDLLQELELLQDLDLLQELEELG